MKRNKALLNKLAKQLVHKERLFIEREARKLVKVYERLCTG